MKKFCLGYTLIELMLALAILAILLLPITRFINHVLLINSNAKDNLQLSMMINKAYESFLRDPQRPYLGENGYEVEYEVEGIEEFKVEGIDYKKYDVIFEINNYKAQIKCKDNVLGQFVDVDTIDINKESDWRIFVYYDKSNNNLQYYISNEKKDVEINVIKPSYGILFLNEDAVEKYKFNVFIEGIYDALNGDFFEHALSCNYVNLDFNCSSVYNNVVFGESNSLSNSDIEERLYLLRIKIIKDGKILKEETFKIKDRDKEV